MRAGSAELDRLTELAGGALGPADVTYWLAQERKDKAPVDLSVFTDYCELDRVLNDGVFYAAMLCGDPDYSDCESAYCLAHPDGQHCPK